MELGHISMYGYGMLDIHGKRIPLAIELTYCFDGYVAKLYRGFACIAPSIECGISTGPDTDTTKRAALRDLHNRWSSRVSR